MTKHLGVPIQIDLPILDVSSREMCRQKTVLDTCESVKTNSVLLTTHVQINWFWDIYVTHEILLLLMLNLEFENFFSKFIDFSSPQNFLIVIYFCLEVFKLLNLN